MDREWRARIETSKRCGCGSTASFGRAGEVSWLAHCWLNFQFVEEGVQAIPVGAVTTGELAVNRTPLGLLEKAIDLEKKGSALRGNACRSNGAGKRTVAESRFVGRGRTMGERCEFAKEMIRAGGARFAGDMSIAFAGKGKLWRGGAVATVLEGKAAQRSFWAVGPLSQHARSVP